MIQKVREEKDFLEYVLLDEATHLLRANVSCAVYMSHGTRPANTFGPLIPQPGPSQLTAMGQSTAHPKESEF